MHKKTLLSLLLLLLAACTPSTQASLPTAPSTLTSAPLPTETWTAEPTSTITTEALPTTTFTATPAPLICSPLMDVPLADLPGRVTNPYHPPAPGSDDPHHGVDIGEFLPNSRVAISGLQVQAAISGRVAAVVQNRFPYGYAVLVETPLGVLAPDLLQTEVPTPAPTLEYRSALTCPEATPLTLVDPQARSLYVLYAHLKEPPMVNVEDPVTCGQQLGIIGDSGNALNPHLHFEARVAPAGLRLGSMAHYDASATTEEMSRYCLWRISGLFQLVDPMQILQAQ